MDKLQQQLVLKAFSQITPLSQTDIDEALGHFRFQSYQAKEYIFACGDLVADVHFVLAGVGRYFYLDEQGFERNKSLVRAGGAFAAISSLVENAPSPFFAQALTPCTVVVINYQKLVQLSLTNLNWCHFLRKVFERLVLKKEKREAGLLMLSAKERYQQFLTEFAEDSQHIALRHVAMYIGVTDVTLSRIRREMGLT